MGGCRCRLWRGFQKGFAYCELEGFDACGQAGCQWLPPWGDVNTELLVLLTLRPVLRRCTVAILAC